MQTPWGDLAVSDAHVHFFSRRFFDALGGQCGKGVEDVAQAAEWDLPAADPRELATRWAEELDAHGVSRAALIASVPGDEASVLQAAAAQPGRFFGYAMFNPLEPDAPSRAQSAFESGMQRALPFSRHAPLLDARPARRGRCSKSRLPSRIARSSCIAAC